MSKKQIAIIGAGYTGLTAAYELLKKGFEVTIYERSEFVGGLASDFTIEGEHLEKAYHHLFRTDTDIISLVDELGLHDKLEWHNSSVSIYLNEKVWPFMTPGDLLNFKPISLFARLRAGITALLLQKYPNYKPFLKQTAYSWMKQYAGNEVINAIWGPLLKGKFHQYYDKVSMAWLWARIHTRANSKNPGESQEKLGYPNGGFDVITKALVAQIMEMGGSIVTSANISSISGGSKPTLIVNEQTLHPDAVIATVPNHVFAQLVKEDSHLTPEYTKKLQSIEYLGAALHIFSSEQSLSNYYWHNINEQDSPFLVFIQHTNLTGTERYNGKHVYYIGTYIPHDHIYFSHPKEQIIAEWHAYLKKIFPAFDESKIQESHFFQFKNAQHIVTTDYLEKVPGRVTPLKNVYLSNFTQIFPEDRGTNFSVRDGREIARIVSESLQENR